MKREIKFRGKAINTNEWVYGLLRIFKNRSYEKYFIVSELEIGGTEVIKDSVGQYAEKKDQYGIEIYEGDVVSYDLREGLGEPRKNHLEKIIELGPYGAFGAWDINIRVKGNIQENPELIKNYSLPF